MNRTDAEVKSALERKSTVFLEEVLAQSTRYVAILEATGCTSNKSKAALARGHSMIKAANEILKERAERVAMATVEHFKKMVEGGELPARVGDPLRVIFVSDFGTAPEINEVIDEYQKAMPDAAITVTEVSKANEKPELKELYRVPPKKI